MMRIRGPISFYEFKQRVRRHRTTDVLKGIAAFSSELVNRSFRSGSPSGESNVVQHFALAAAARAALLYGNECCRKPLGRDDLRNMCGYFSQVRDPVLDEEPGTERMRGMFNRILYEQVVFQYSEMESVGRSVALLLDHAEACEGALSAEEWRDLLGVTLEEFMRIGFGMHVAALCNGGQISRDLLKAPHVAPIFTPLTVELALTVIDTMYAGTIAELRELGHKREVSGLEKWSFNPLVEKPIVTIGRNFVMPIPRYIIDRFTPTGLYFIALAKYGSRFTDSLGCMFERYIGTQLSQINAWTIHGEIVYGLQGEKTVDFFVVTDSCVLLVEVKAARPIQATRVGDLSSDTDIEKKIGHAIEQINRSAALLESDSALAHVNPAGLPVRGLVVTLEPFHLVNTPIYADVLTLADLPLIVVSAHELEGFIAAVLSEPDPDVYLDLAYNPQDELAPRSLAAAVSGLENDPNPILDKAWDRFMGPIKDLDMAEGDVAEA